MPKNERKKSFLNKEIDYILTGVYPLQKSVKECKMLGYGIIY